MELDRDPGWWGQGLCKRGLNNAGKAVRDHPLKARVWHGIFVRALFWSLLMPVACLPSHWVGTKRQLKGRGGASSEGLGLEGPFPAEGGFLLRPEQI